MEKVYYHKKEHALFKEKRQEGDIILILERVFMITLCHIFVCIYLFQFSNYFGRDPY